MRTSVVFLEQQSWVGGAQRVLEAALNSIGPEYERIVTFPDRGPFRSALEERDIETMDLPIARYSRSLIGFALMTCRVKRYGMIAASN